MSRPAEEADPDTVIRTGGIGRGRTRPSFGTRTHAKPVDDRSPLLPRSVPPLDGPQLARRAIDQSDTVEPGVQRQYVVDGRGQHRQLRQWRTRSHRTMRQPSAGTVVLVQFRTGPGDRLHHPFLTRVQLGAPARQQPGPPPPEQPDAVKTELNRRKATHSEQRRRDLRQIPTPQHRVRDVRHMSPVSMRPQARHPDALQTIPQRPHGTLRATVEQQAHRQRHPATVIGRRARANPTGDTTSPTSAALSTTPRRLSRTRARRQHRVDTAAATASPPLVVTLVIGSEIHRVRVGHSQPLTPAARLPMWPRFCGELSGWAFLRSEALLEPLRTARGCQLAIDDHRYRQL